MQSSPTFLGAHDVLLDAEPQSFGAGLGTPKLKVQVGAAVQHESFAASMGNEPSFSLAPMATWKPLAPDAAAASQQQADGLYLRAAAGSGPGSPSPVHLWLEDGVEDGRITRVGPYRLRVLQVRHVPAPEPSPSTCSVPKRLRAEAGSARRGSAAGKP